MTQMSISQKSTIEISVRISRTRWLPLVGFLELKVSLAKEPYQRDNILRETYHFKEPTNHSHPIAI